MSCGKKSGPGVGRGTIAGYRPLHQTINKSGPCVDVSGGRRNGRESWWLQVAFSFLFATVSGLALLLLGISTNTSETRVDE